jgi:hypothetical protein
MRMARCAWALAAFVLLSCGGESVPRRLDAGPKVDAAPVVDAAPPADGPDAGPASMCGELPPGVFECPQGCESFSCDSPCAMYCGTDCYECVYVTEPYPSWRWQQQFIDCSCPDAGP